jgi:hypothetical protein
VLFERDRGSYRDALPLQRFADGVSEPIAPLPCDRSSRPCACASAEDLPEGPCGRIGLGRGPLRVWASGFEVGRVPLRRVISCVSSAASSAIVGVRFDAPTRDRPARSSREIWKLGAGTSGRSGSAGPVESRPLAYNRLASEAAK